MNGKISRCIICGKFFDSKRELKDHKDKDHRITDSKVEKLIIVVIGSTMIVGFFFFLHYRV
jgi:hypothetical protein